MKGGESDGTVEGAKWRTRPRRQTASLGQAAAGAARRRLPSGAQFLYPKTPSLPVREYSIEKRSSRRTFPLPRASRTKITGTHWWRGRKVRKHLRREAIRPARSQVCTASPHRHRQHQQRRRTRREGSRGGTGPKFPTRADASRRRRRTGSGFDPDLRLAEGAGSSGCPSRALLLLRCDAERPPRQRDAHARCAPEQPGYRIFRRTSLGKHVPHCDGARRYAVDWR